MRTVIVTVALLFGSVASLAGQLSCQDYLNLGSTRTYYAVGMWDGMVAAQGYIKANEQSIYDDTIPTDPEGSKDAIALGYRRGASAIVASLDSLLSIRPRTNRELGDRLAVYCRRPGNREKAVRNFFYRVLSELGESE